MAFLGRQICCLCKSDAKAVSCDRGASDSNITLSNFLPHPKSIIKGDESGEG